MNGLKQYRGVTSFRADAKVMVVDDEPANIDVVEKMLRRAGYTHVFATVDANEAIASYTRFQPDIILLDLNMPELSGFDVLDILRESVERDLVPIVVLTGDPSVDSTRKALSSGARDFVAKPFEAVELLLRVENLLETRFAHLSVTEQKDHLEQRVLERTRDLVNAELETLRLLARASEFRDDDTGRHTHRVGALAARIAQRMGCDHQQVSLIAAAAPLHDLGKIGVPDSILLKPGPLTPDERVIMETHAAIGAQIIGETDFPILRTAREIALAHHERFDGGGYPHRSRGADIPLTARIVAGADVFDALTHVRPYRAALPLELVVAMISDQRGKHFDPDVADSLIQLIQEGAFKP